MRFPRTFVSTLVSLGPQARDCKRRRSSPSSIRVIDLSSSSFDRQEANLHMRAVPFFIYLFVDQMLHLSSRKGTRGLRLNVNNTTAYSKKKDSKSHRNDCNGLFKGRKQQEPKMPMTSITCNKDTSNSFFPFKNLPVKVHLQQEIKIQ